MGTSDSDWLGYAAFVVAVVGLLLAVHAAANVHVLREKLDVLEHRVGLQEMSVDACDRRARDALDLSVRCCTR